MVRVLTRLQSPKGDAYDQVTKSFKTQQRTALRHIMDVLWISSFGYPWGKSDNLANAADLQYGLHSLCTDLSSMGAPAAAAVNKAAYQAALTPHTLSPHPPQAHNHLKPVPDQEPPPLQPPQQVAADLALHLCCPVMAQVLTHLTVQQHVEGKVVM